MTHSKRIYEKWKRSSIIQPSGREIGAAGLKMDVDV